MKKLSIVLAAFLLPISVIATTVQEKFAEKEEPKENQEEKDSPLGFRLSGFVKTDYWWDSRSVVAAREDLFLLFPAKEKLDFNGADINGDARFNFSAITSRITGHISGPDAFGAKTSGIIEADFSGVTNADINGFRLRHAFVKMDWGSWDVLLGQWWHPMFTTDAVPTMVSLNTGAPFQPFIRNPQISLSYHRGNIQTLFAAIAQRDNASDGPQGPGPDYMRYSATPNLHTQLIYRDSNISTGLGVDYKSLRPRLETESEFKTTSLINTYAFMGFFRYRQNLWDFKTKAIWGQNLTEHLLLGGYAESTIDEVMGHVTYTPIEHFFSWINLTYGQNTRVGFFAGYAQNLGAKDSIEGKSYGRGNDIEYMYRFAPHISVRSGNVELATELEYTLAAYGTPNNKGLVQNSSEVANYRLLFTAFYYF